MKLKKFSAAALAALTVTMMSAAPVLAADDIEVNEDISVSGDYDWKRFANDHITLNVYNNGLYISDGSDESINVLSAFEELTGIKVNYTTYDSNESLYAKLKSGGVSYDVIFPSDYMVGKMAKEGMLSELNMDNIPNFAGIGETYLDRSFDPGNKYSVPYMWGTTGLIYNTTMVEEPPTKWADMWDVAYTNNVLMFNNSRDAYAIAAKTIGLSMNPQSVDEITAITDALKAQKNIVQAYVMDEVFDKMEGGEAAMAPYYAGDAITKTQTLLSSTRRKASTSSSTACAFRPTPSTGRPPKCSSTTCVSRTSALPTRTSSAIPPPSPPCGRCWTTI